MQNGAFLPLPLAKFLATVSTEFYYSVTIGRECALQQITHLPPLQQKAFYDFLVVSLAELSDPGLALAAEPESLVILAPSYCTFPYSLYFPTRHFDPLTLN